MRLTAACAASAFLLAWFPAAAPAARSAEPGPAAELARGKESLEAKCRLCHSLQMVLAKRKTRAEWGQTVKKMVLYGASLAPADREAVARYLAAQTLFAERCGLCHEPARVLDEAKGGRDWGKLVGRMVAHFADLEKAGKAPAGGLSAADAGEVGALLQVLLP